jgi:hypothetical protein
MIFKYSKTVLQNLLFSKHSDHVLCKQAVAAVIASTRIQMDGLPHSTLFSYNSSLEKKKKIKLYLFYLKLISQVRQVYPTSFMEKNHAYFPNLLHIHDYIGINI